MMVAAFTPCVSRFRFRAIVRGVHLWQERNDTLLLTYLAGVTKSAGALAEVSASLSTGNPCRSPLCTTYASFAFGVYSCCGHQLTKKTELAFERKRKGFGGPGHHKF